MKTLQFTLTHKWFEAHLNGKREEYREITPYWTQRLFCHIGMKTLSHYDANRACGFIRENGRPPSYIQPRKFDSATGNDAYTKRTFTKEFFGVSIGIGNPAWGASNNPVFIIKCGDIIATRNTHEKEINP